MILDPHAIHIFTDGSAFRNPGGSCGCAGRVEYPDHLQREEDLIFDLGYIASTNNRMELLACIHAVRWVCENSPSWPTVARIQIITDSKYVKDGVTYSQEWRKNGWNNRHGEPMENSDLWKELHRLQTRARIRVDFVWMHDKESPILLRVHHDAKAAAKRGGTYIDTGFNPGWVTRSMVKGSATRFQAAGQSAMVRPYRKKRMKNGEWKIRFDVISEDGQSYVQSCYAYAVSELALGELHSQNGYRVRFDDNPKHPQILQMIEKVETPKRK